MYDKHTSEIPLVDELITTVAEDIEEALLKIIGDTDSKFIFKESFLPEIKELFNTKYGLSSSKED
jgi:hypothetical protein